MSKSKAASPATMPTAATVGEFDDKMRGKLENIGGSKSDHFNSLLTRQVVDALWLKNSDPETRDKQLSAAIGAMIGIAPKDELEGMLAAQLLASHSAAMECYRRAMIGEQTFIGRAENLAQANKLSRTFATLIEALNRHRGKGQQTVRVEHVHVHAGGQAVVGVVGAPGGRDGRKSEGQGRAQIAHAPEQALRSPDTSRIALQSPARQNGRCRMHGGNSPGAPKGNSYALKHGRYTAEAIAERRRFAQLLRDMRGLVEMVQVVDGTP